MADQVTNLKCPACTGPMHFDAASGKMHCDYCGSSFTVAEIEQLYSGKNDAAVAAAKAAEEANAAAPVDEGEGVDGWELGNAGSRWGNDGEGLKVFNCPSCGAELICDDSTAATSCPYCDNPTVIPSTLSGSLKPDCIVPFKLNREQAKDAFRSHLKGKKLLPKLFYEESHLDEIKGIYVPFWLFDATANADITYTGTQRRTWSDPNFTYTEHRIYDLVRGGELSFDNVPVDGSEKMANELMESIEPFDLSEAVDFKTAYLAGYFADKYDVPASDCVSRANERMQQSVKDIFVSTTAGYSDVAPKASYIHVEKGAARYALLPVWILNTTWRGEKHIFAMNGQTGKFVGNLPCDDKLKRKYQLLYTGIFAAALFAVELVMHLM